jgi:carboxypeptidase T
LWLNSCCLSLNMQAQSVEKYALVAIDMAHKTPDDLARLDIGLDHFDYDKHAQKMTVYLNERELQNLKAANYGYEIMIPDATAHFLQQNQAANTTAAKRNDIACQDDLPAYPVPTGFDLGSMGGYFTYQEMLDRLDSLAAQYPNLISTRQPIGNWLTAEGRPIYYIKISDNVTQNESNEPEMLYTALHHAREAMTLSQMLFYIYYLLENYDDNGTVQEIINNTALYFVPCVNPDGYIFNETIYPNGGGMWRKNRRNNGDGSFGVDLNRNYGYNWGYDNTGSSPTTVGETYRGTAAFSEPETSAIRELCQNHSFKYAINFHSYNEALLLPWGYGDTDMLEREYYNNLLQDLTETSHYNFGTCNDMLSYYANGNSDDWMYGEQNEKGKIYAFTPEIGTDFWQPSTDIIPICLQMLPFNLRTAASLLNHANVRDVSSYLIGSTTHQLSFDITRIGQMPDMDFTISCVPISPEIIAVSDPVTISNLDINESLRDTITLQIAPEALDNNMDIYYVVQVNNGYYTQSDTVRRRAGHWDLLLNDSFNNPANWTTTFPPISPPQTIPLSDISQDNCPTPPNCYHCSNLIAEPWFAPQDTLDLSGITEAYAQCQMKWNTKMRHSGVWWAPTYDGYFDVIPTCGLYSKVGNDYVGNIPQYDGVQKNWVLETIDLSNVTGMQVRLGFMGNADTDNESLWLDDLQVWIRGQNPVSLPSTSNHTTGFTCYPNPTTDHITIDLSQQINNISPNNYLNIQLSDVAGRTLKTYQLQTHQFADNCRLRLPLKNIPDGVYLLNIYQVQKHLGYQKIVVKH